MKLWVTMPIHGQWNLVQGALDSLDESEGCEDIEMHLHTIDTAGPKIPHELLERHGAHFSTDWTHDMLEKNPGVTVPWNLGIKAGLAWGADAICITNSDVVFGKSVVRECMAALQSGIGCCYPWTYRQGGPLPENFATVDAAHAATHGVYECTGGMAGWCFFLSRKTIEQVGLFDEQFQLWFQDSQYHWRLARCGIKPVEVRSCALHHYESRTILSMPGGFSVNGWQASDSAKWGVWSDWWKRKCEDPSWQPTADCYKAEQESR